MQEHSTSHISHLRHRKKRLFKRAGSFLLIFSVSVFLLVFVWQRVQVIKTGYEIEKLKKERDGLLKVNQSLKIEAASLTSPDRIETIADKDIGMRAPNDTQIVLVKKVKNGARTGQGPTKTVERPGPQPGRS